MVDLQDQVIRQHCKALRMPPIGGQFVRLAEAATREGQSHAGYLEALLAAEMEEREPEHPARSHAPEAVRHECTYLPCVQRREG